MIQTTVFLASQKRKEESKMGLLARAKKPETKPTPPKAQEWEYNCCVSISSMWYNGPRLICCIGMLQVQARRLLKSKLQA